MGFLYCLTWWNWARIYFNAEDCAIPEVSGVTADPDCDTLPNLAECAFGGNPWTNSRHLLPRWTLTKSYLEANQTGLDDEPKSVSYLEVSYRQRKGGVGTVGVNYTANGITYVVEVADDIQSGIWQTGPSVVGQVGPAVDNGDGTETVTVRHLVPLEQADRKFMRMKLILNGG